MRRVRSFNVLFVGRSFQYVSDLVNGLVSLMNSNYTLPVNIGNPDEHTISTFAHLIRFAFHFISHLKQRKENEIHAYGQCCGTGTAGTGTFLP
jgi:nucleoside-diphosphate-sugar epimerase